MNTRYDFRYEILFDGPQDAVTQDFTQLCLNRYTTIIEHPPEKIIIEEGGATGFERDWGKGKCGNFEYIPEKGIKNCYIVIGNADWMAFGHMTLLPGNRIWIDVIADEPLPDDHRHLVFMPHKW